MACYPAGVAEDGYTMVKMGWTWYKDIKKGIFANRTATQWIFSHFLTILCKPKRSLGIKIPVDEQFLK